MNIKNAEMISSAIHAANVGIDNVRMAIGQLEDFFSSNGASGDVDRDVDRIVSQAEKAAIDLLAKCNEYRVAKQLPK